jgi:hypothetical protein
MVLPRWWRSRAHGQNQGQAHLSPPHGHEAAQRHLPPSFLPPGALPRPLGHRRRGRTCSHPHLFRRAHHPRRRPGPARDARAFSGRRSALGGGSAGQRLAGAGKFSRSFTFWRWWGSLPGFEHHRFHGLVPPDGTWETSTSTSLLAATGLRLHGQPSASWLCHHFAIALSTTVVG